MYRVFHSLDEARDAFGPCALSIGNFDGVHIGHQAIFREVVRIAVQNGWKPAVLTFDPHPMKVVAPNRAPKLLSALADRCIWMRECGIEHILILPFDHAIAALGPEDFVRRILAGPLDAKAVLVGDNFRFGNRQAGDTQTLRELGRSAGFGAHAIPAVRLRGRAVSSTAIRQCLAGGEVTPAARLLGRFYFVDGAVVRGHGIGSRQTVPTLNLDTDAEVLPATGVYVTRTADLETGQRWASVTNAGYRPTFGGDRFGIETFLLDPFPAQAPTRLRIEFLHRIREERRFDTAEALKNQILTDVGVARKWHRRLGRWVLGRQNQPEPR